MPDLDQRRPASSPSWWAGPETAAPTLEPHDNGLAKDQVAAANPFGIDADGGFFGALPPPGILRYGDSGPAVRSLQEWLGKRAFPVFVDGEFGDETRGALEGFQRLHGVKVDGVYGPNTADRLANPAAPIGKTPEVSDAKPEPTYSWATGLSAEEELPSRQPGIESPEWSKTLDPEARRADPVRDKIPHLHVILEQLARCAYDKRDPTNDEVLARQYELNGVGYCQVRMTSDPVTGLQVVLYAPTRERAPMAGEHAIPGLSGGALPTVVAFCGTGSMADVWDDANSAGVGTYQFSLHEAEIRGLFVQANGLGFGKPFSIGHSLGGAQAQIAAARMGELIGEVVTFQSPGINAEDAARVDPSQIPSTHHRVSGDGVPVAGERLTEGTLYTHTAHKKSLTNVEGHVDKPLAALNADREDAGDEHVQGLENLAPAAEDRPEFTTTMRRDHDRTLADGWLEPARRTVGGLFTTEMAAAVDAWGEVREGIPAWVDAGQTPVEVGERVRAHLDAVAIRSAGIPGVAMTHVRIDRDIIDRLVEQAEMLAQQHVIEQRHGQFWERDAGADW